MTSMQGLNSLPSDDDVLDSILLFLPDFSTLLATILSCKSFNRVFNSHSKTILRSVLYNRMGPALPQALRVLRYKSPSTSGEDTSEPTDAPKPWGEGDPIEPITNDEYLELSQIFITTRNLEDIFSWRAVYRLMLYTDIFSFEKYQNFEANGGSFTPEFSSREHLARRKFLEDFPAAELSQIGSVANFLAQLARWTQIAVYRSTDRYFSLGRFDSDVALLHGPKAILEIYRQASMVDSELSSRSSPLINGNISGPLQTICREHRILSTLVSKRLDWSSILDEVRGEKDTYWNHLKGVFRSLHPESIFSLAKGNICKGPDRATLLFELNKVLKRSYDDFFDQIHEVRRYPYVIWKKSDWLCVKCLREILKEHLHHWLLERKRADGQLQIKEDCWCDFLMQI
ncbi:hypothetical protein H0H92_002553 [Tricholoma furcatifolium]|nr:hypothetical protein H0H92_002553 [Tricholoma furcatifolium]